MPLNTEYKISLRTDFFLNAILFETKIQKFILEYNKSLFKKDSLLIIVFIEISSSFDVSKKRISVAKKAR